MRAHTQGLQNLPTGHPSKTGTQGSLQKQIADLVRENSHEIPIVNASSMHHKDEVRFR